MSTEYDKDDAQLLILMIVIIFLFGVLGGIQLQKNEDKESTCQCRCSQ